MQRRELLKMASGGMAAAATPMMAGALAGAIARLIWPNLPDGSAAIGAVLGCALAIVAIAWRRRRSGRRSLGAYPPVVELRKAGWSYAS